MADWIPSERWAAERGAGFYAEAKAEPDAPTPAARDRWAALKARGDYTIAEIDAIASATPGAERELGWWWLEMMEARRKLQNAQVRAGHFAKKS